MKKQHDAYIVGYYGMTNSGDDALMCAADMGVNLMMPNSKNLITCATKLLTETDGQVAVLPSSKIKGLQRFSHYKNALQSRNVVFGGGSVLHSKKDIEFKHHLLKLSGGEYSRCVGVGIEPFQSVDTEKACAKFLNAMPFVGLRDKQSFEIAQSIAPHANLHLTFDLAPTLLNNKEKFNRQNQTGGIAFNFCPKAKDAFGNVDEKSELDRINRAVATIEECAQQTNEPIFLIDFNGNLRNGDTPIHNKIRAKLPSHIKVTHLAYEPDPFKLMHRLSGFKVVVGMRLHAAILAFLVETPCISINYHKKCIGWCDQIGVPDLYQFSSENFRPSDISSAILDGIGTGFAKSRLSVDEARSASLRNWRKPV